MATQSLMRRLPPVSVMIAGLALAIMLVLVVFAPMIAPMDPRDVSSYSLIDMEIPPAFMEGGDPKVGSVQALAYGNGTLYAGGYFNRAGGKAVNYIAQWSGGQWSALGSGVKDEDFSTETPINALPADLRKELPPLELSMHMWDPDPARRFVILDGARHGEGDSVGPMRIRRIDADGVLFDWQGRALRLPLR